MLKAINTGFSQILRKKYLAKTMLVIKLWYRRELIVAYQLMQVVSYVSSQTKDLDCRTYIYPVCGIVMDRDINASSISGGSHYLKNIKF